MQSMKKWSVVLFVLFVFTASTAIAQVLDPAEELFQAQQAGKPIPVLSIQHPAMDTAMAYQIQKAFVEKILTKDKIAGFKAGLTTEGGQKKFGVDAPLAGVLFESGKLADNATIDHVAFHALMLETEVGFVIGSAITEPLKDVAELQTHIQAVMPAIEVPDLGFADMKQLKGLDIIAANVSARQFIVGQEKAVEGTDLNAITVKLALDGQEVNVGKGADALGDQWQAALWLVNTTIEHGWNLEPGQIIITGALGNMVPGKPGKYLADFGDFGQLNFEVK
ncbi:2-hydroxypenta-2,4-dienoate hydratase [Candidatus Vecturithrix granuli]|uniref:2-hydroxypenta-2,4-dienoate hydratase n=1 Tax=Vecturithrix granuli TaxID=1499967 RepID=A0A081C2R6_VECG1|nr:2-hydroxypenta-2,4-dienoate hydratase [Candidatus Vecturithrix granuli]